MDDENFKYLTETGESVGEYSPDFIRFGGLKELSDEEKETIPSFDKVKEKTFPSMLEKNIYLSGRLLQDMKESGYYIASFT